MKKILELYKENYPIYNDFANIIQKLIITLLIEKNIRVHSVISRIKEETSLKNKINKNLKKYTKIEDITDLCGIRIITYFEDDVDQVAEIIQKVLAIDLINAVDKRKLLAATEFGYLSLHLIASLTTKQLQLSTYKKYENCKIEIQICSILQHAWAEIEHDLGYKSQTAISYDVRRRFSRLAGLMEIADIEFRELRNDLQPSRLLVPKPVFSSIINLSNKSILEKFSEKLINKFIFVKTLSTGIAEHTKLTPLQKASGYALMSILLVLIKTHLAPISHLLSPIIATLKTEEMILHSLVSTHIIV